MRKFVFFLVAVICLYGTWAFAADVRIIVNPDILVDSLEKDQVSKMFLGKKTVWDSGERIMPAILKSGDVHDHFLKNIVNKNPNQFSMYWKRIIFTGKGVGPKTFDKESELLEYVANTKGAIGYIGEDTKPEGVKTVSLE